MTKQTDLQLTDLKENTMNKVFAAIAVAAVAMAGSAAVAETVVGPQHAKVRAQWAALDGKEQPNPIVSLIELLTGPAKVLSEAPADNVAKTK